MGTTHSNYNVYTHGGDTDKDDVYGGEYGNDDDDDADDRDDDDDDDDDDDEMRYRRMAGHIEIT